MTIKEFKDLANKLDERYDDYELKIIINKPNTLGGTPGVRVENIGVGFDWNNGTILIRPEKELIEKP